LHLFQGVGTELVRHPLFDTMALNDVARLHVVGQDQHLVPDRAACFLYLGHGPHAVLFAHPERKASSVGAVEDVTASDPGRDRNLLPSPCAKRLRHRSSPSVLVYFEQSLDLPPVESDDHLAVNDRDRGCSNPQLKKFLQSLLVFPDVLRGEFHTLLRKKLFLGIAGASSR